MFVGYRNQIKRWRMLGLSMQTLGAIAEFLYHASFITADAAPLGSPRVAEPGPGDSTFIDSLNTWDISGEQLVPNAVGTANGDPAILEDVARIQAAGLCAYFKIRNYTALGGSSANAFVCGWSDDNTPGFADLIGVDFLGSVNAYRPLLQSGAVPNTLDIYTDDTLIDVFVILTDPGFIAIVESTREVIWVDTVATNASWFIAASSIAAGRQNFGLDDIKTVELPSPWDTTFGFATDRLAGARSAGDTFTHEGDCHIKATVTTVPSAGQIELRFRIQNATNYWQATVDSTGALDLDEVVAGVPTQRGTAAGVVANGDQLNIICLDETIQVSENNTVRITYVAAVNFKTETDGELETEGTAGSVSDIITYPKVASGDFKRILDEVP